MKTVISVFSILVLILIGLVSLFVINDPAYAQQLVGLSAPPTPPPKRIIALSDTPTGFDRKSAETAEPKRPPTREEFQKQLEKESAVMQIGRSGRFVRFLSTAGNTEPPPPELYPFAVNRRTYPDASSISVELAIKNQSGIHWETAYVSLRSPYIKDTALFQIDEWQIDEVVGLEYVFPRAELEDRIKDLRVVGVSGKERQSALSKRLSDSRREVIESVNLGKKRRRAGDALSASGLLGILGRFQEPYTGIPVVQTKMSTPKTRQIVVEIPQEQLLPVALGLNFRQTSEERRVVSEKLQKFHDLALKTQEQIDQLAIELNGKNVQQINDSAKVQELIPQIQATLSEFDQVGVELASEVLRSKDAEIRAVNSIIVGHSQKLLAQIQAVEDGVNVVNPAFKIRNRA